MVNLKNLKTILWCPSGGMGHCLHNLAWALHLSNKLKAKFYMYGFHLHKPFQDHFDNVFNFTNNVEYKELKDDTELNNFIKEKKVNAEGIEFIKKRGYRTGKKFLDDKKSVILICSTQKRKITNFTFKQEYLKNVVGNPYKFYKNDFNLSNMCEKPKTCDCYNFEIGKKYSYRITLNVNNRKLKIGPLDKGYYKVKKELIINYLDKDNEEHTKICIEGNIEKIDKIKKIKSATYGVKDKKIDVTKKIISLLVPINEKNLKKLDVTKEKEKIEHILNNEKYIAVHYRGRDKQAKGGEKKKIKEIKLLAKKAKIKNIFIATDNCNFFDFLNKELPSSFFIFRYTSPPRGGVNIHYNTKDFTKGENLYKTILDIDTCRKATHFIPSLNSGFSVLVNELK